MAILRNCMKCRSVQYDNSRGQCLKCLQNQKFMIFEKWKNGKTIDDQIKELFFMIHEKEDKINKF